MAKPKKPTKKPPQPRKSNGKGTTVHERLANAKKIGERLETMTELLSPSQVESERAKVCTLHRDLDRVESDLKTLAAGHKARIKEIKAGINNAVAVANAAKRDVEVTIEEFLTGRNEVIRVRADTGEIIGNRIAKVEELQEEMFVDDDDDDLDDEPGDPKTATTPDDNAAPEDLIGEPDEFGENNA